MSTGQYLVTHQSTKLCCCNPRCLKNVNFHRWKKWTWSAQINSEFPSKRLPFNYIWIRLWKIAPFNKILANLANKAPRIRTQNQLLWVSRVHDHFYSIIFNKKLRQVRLIGIMMVFRWKEKTSMRREGVNIAWSYLYARL